MWLNAVLYLIKYGKVKRIISRLKRHQGQGEKSSKNLAEYLERFQDAVHYERFRLFGLPIGSGEIESAHRYIPQKRLKIPGATWHPNTINPMLALRIIRANDWWNDFWSQINFKKKLA